MPLRYSIASYLLMITSNPGDVDQVASSTSPGAPIIIECNWKYNDGGSGAITYKIDTENWSYFNRSRWEWEKVDCNNGFGRIGMPKMDTTCSSEINENEYKWKEAAKQYAPGAFLVNYRLIISINRQSANASHSEIYRSEYISTGKSDYESVAGDGVCKAAPDPANLPRPKPKL